MTKRRICVVTGTRAEYGLLYWLMKGIQSDDELELQLIVTGMHLSPEFGLTYRQIEEDGFLIDEKLEMLLSSDTAIGVSKSMGLVTIGAADALNRLKPDLLIVLGDRFEMMAVAQVALVMRIPIAHIAGGDITEGAYDDAIRHSITKMSHLHFATNEESYQRIIQLGEQPEFVHLVGSLGIDNIKRLELLSKEDLSHQLNYQFQEKNILFTFHPATNEDDSSAKQVNIVLDAMGELLQKYNLGIIFTKANADNGGREINRQIQFFCEKNKNSMLFDSLGQIKYLSALKYVDAVVGNSSSGLYEVPSFGIPTLNIGKRQSGRIKASSIIDVSVNQEEIINGMEYALGADFSSTINPYGNGDTSKKIIDIIKQQPIFSTMKRFYNYKG